MLNLSNHSQRKVICINNTPKKPKYCSRTDYSDRLTVGKEYLIWVLLGDRVYIKGDEPNVWYCASSIKEK